MNEPPRLIDAFIDRLLELAAGAEPDNRELGICSDLRAMTPLSNRAYGVMSHYTGDYNPLGDASAPGNKWSGPRGKRRRKLCFDVAVQALASINNDYRGKYR